MQRERKCDHEDVVDVRKIIQPLKIFEPTENKGVDRRVTRRNAALGDGLMPESPRLRGRERSEIYESHEIEENLRGLNTLR